jgi:hypothetical protein
LALINDIATVIGLVTGVSGFTLGLLNYLRDKPRVKVELSWEMTTTDTQEKVGVIRVANVGRRPVFLSHVALKIPKGYGESYLILRDGINGRKLSEGDAPISFPVTYDNMEKYSKVWSDILAQVNDSAGKVYLSKKAIVEPIPSWVKES